MILLTGANGYLGQYVARKLPGAVWSVEGPRQPRGCDLTHPDHVRTLFREVQPQCIVHCAANVPKSAEEYGDDAAARQSALMTSYVRRHSAAPIVFASTLSIHAHTAYAAGKRAAERCLRRRDVILRLPGLFGLPRRSGVIYDSALKGEIKASYGPYPAMHVADAAEYLARAATMPSDGKPEPFTVTYGDPRLEACYGSLGVTFEQRVRELLTQVRQEQVA